ncbi:hypothetical protein ACJJTC_016832 [Scirpophaga incertulas]
MLRETRNWFSNSPLRIKMYEQIYETLNNNKKPPTLVKLAPTRWLSFYAAVEANIKQWIPLKTHFDIICSQEKCYQARELAIMYKDDTNLLYLVFLAPLLKEMATARRVFKPTFLSAYQNDNPFMQDIEVVQLAVLKSRSEFGNSVLELESIDYGHKFEEVVRDSNVTANKLSEVVQGLKCFNPETACSLQYNRQKITDMPWVLAASDVNREDIESQWRRLSTMALEEIPAIEKDNLTPEIFWSSISKMTNSGGQYIYKELAEFALRALSLPISNAN